MKHRLFLHCIKLLTLFIIVLGLLSISCTKTGVKDCFKFACPLYINKWVLKPGDPIFYAFGAPRLPGSVTYSLIAGTLPPGIELKTVNNQAQLVGTPTLDAGTTGNKEYAFTVEIRNDLGEFCHDDFHVTVAPGSPGYSTLPPQIVAQGMTIVCDPKELGKKIGFVPSVFGPNPVTWYIKIDGIEYPIAISTPMPLGTPSPSPSSGNELVDIPPGMKFDPKTGELSGIPKGPIEAEIGARDPISRKETPPHVPQKVKITFDLPGPDEGDGGKGGGTCGSNADCASFGRLYCSGANNAKCGADGLCHCCEVFCPGGVNCTCNGCNSCLTTSKCEQGVCLITPGGAPVP